MILGVDLETCSAADLIGDGSWIYSLHPSTRVHCAVFGFASGLGDYDMHVWLPGQQLPPRVVAHLQAGKPLLAHNAGFEQAIIENVLSKHHGWPNPPLDAWQDTAMRACAVNLPYSLAGVAKSFKAAPKKDTEGGDLMRRLAVVLPSDGGWSYPDVTEEDLERLIEYCRQDVRVMLDVHFRLPKLTLHEELVAAADREINHRGVFVDQEFAAQMSSMVDERKRQLRDSAFLASETRLADAISAPGMKTWLQERGIQLPTKVRAKADGTREKTVTIDKVAVKKLLEDHGLDPTIRSVLETRLESGRATSLAKLKRIPSMTGPDGRVRGLLHYCAANTGRWASRGLQLHNLPKDKIGAPDFVRAMVRAGDIEGLKFAAAQPLEALSQSLRSVIVAAPGHDLIGGDYSAIEARVLAWLAGQDDVLDAFADPSRDIYTEDAAKVGSSDRQFGKVQRLGLGYGMGAVKFATTAAGYGFVLSLKEARRVQLGWREHNPQIVAFWYDLERAFREAIKRPGHQERVERVVVRSSVATTKTGGPTNVTIELPSGRRLYYWQPCVRLVKKRFETVDEEGNLVVSDREVEEIQFATPEGASQMGADSTYSGKLAENVTQAVARDLLAAALVRFRGTIYRIVLHVHDSIVAEVPSGTGEVSQFANLMAEAPPWGRSLPVKVDGYRSKHFRG